MNDEYRASQPDDRDAIAAVRDAMTPIAGAIEGMRTWLEENQRSVADRPIIMRPPQPNGLPILKSKACMDVGP
ncbi:hypothetical protein GF314_03865, partial [bacterium]|nr:hypothetical protein [bacterium]